MASRGLRRGVSATSAWTARRSPIRPVSRPARCSRPPRVSSSITRTEARASATTRLPPRLPILDNGSGIEDEASARSPSTSRSTSTDRDTRTSTSSSPRWCGASASSRGHTIHGKAPAIVGRCPLRPRRPRARLAPAQDQLRVVRSGEGSCASRPPRRRTRTSSRRSRCARRRASARTGPRSRRPSTRSTAWTSPTPITSASSRPRTPRAPTSPAWCAWTTSAPGASATTTRTRTSTRSSPTNCTLGGSCAEAAQGVRSARVIVGAELDHATGSGAHFSIAPWVMWTDFLSRQNYTGDVNSSNLQPKVDDLGDLWQLTNVETAAGATARFHIDAFSPRELGRGGDGTRSIAAGRSHQPEQGSRQSREPRSLGLPPELRIEHRGRRGISRSGRPTLEEASHLRRRARRLSRRLHQQQARRRGASDPGGAAAGARSPTSPASLPALAPPSRTRSRRRSPRSSRRARAFDRSARAASPCATRRR